WRALQRDGSGEHARDVLLYAADQPDERRQQLADRLVDWLRKHRELHVGWLGHHALGGARGRDPERRWRAVPPRRRHGDTAEQLAGRQLYRYGDTDGVVLSRSSS